MYIVTARFCHVIPLIGYPSNATDTPNVTIGGNGIWYKFHINWSELEFTVRWDGIDNPREVGFHRGGATINVMQFLVSSIPDKIRFQRVIPNYPRPASKDKSSIRQPDHRMIRVTHLIVQSRLFVPHV